MNDTEELAICKKPIELTQKWEQPFRELLDEIFWLGYSEKLLLEKPEEYQREYFYFISMYDEPPLDVDMK